MISLTSWWGKNKKFSLIIIGIVLSIGAVVLILGGYWFKWTGVGFYNKTFWDWMQLLIVPVVLSVGALLFNLATNRNEQKIALDSQRETLLQTYLDRMSELLLNNHLDDLDSNEKTRNIARARTLTVLQRLDAGRKGSLLQFLYESRLIDSDSSIINLYGADLHGADLYGADLRKVDLGGANLSGADLRMADLSGAYLEEADLSETDLKGAILIDAIMVGADLREADLREADLREANLKKVELDEIEPDEIFRVEAKLQLSNASTKVPIFVRGHKYHPYLYGADLSLINLRKADLRKAYMWRADLHEAKLNGANLRGVKITQEQRDKIKSHFRN